MLYTRRNLIGGIAAIALTASAVALGVTGSRAQGPTPAQVKVGEKAPSFTIKTLNGETMNPTALAGKVVLIDFWATWCPPCRASIPFLQDLNDRYKSDGLVVVGISPEDRDTVAPFAEKNKMTYVLSAGRDNARVMNRYGVQGIPTMVLLDRQGRIRLYEVGFNANAVSTTVKKLLAEKSK